MSEYERRSRQGKVTLQDMNIGSADADRANTNDDLAVAGDGDKTMLKLELKLISSEPCQPAHHNLLWCGFAVNP